MTRAMIFVLDSFGLGGARDAEKFGDAGADTLGHIAQSCAAGNGDQPGGRAGPLTLPNLTRLGLARAAMASTGQVPPGLDAKVEPGASFGFGVQISHGKDTPSGHWEICGVPVEFDWGYFPKHVPTFPNSLTEALVARARLPGILGNCHASGTQIIARLGAEHIATGKPICYTSGDSVFQIAAHEEHFGLERLYEICEIAFELVAPHNIGRVIARPFVGETSENFKRTGNRRDFSIPPPGRTLLDTLVDAGGEVISVGKIADIFAHRGISRKIKATGNMALVDATLQALASAGDRSLIFTNFVDFDQLYGHRRDVPGYAAALEAFDARIPEIEARLGPGDLAVFTADHGCDPTWEGTDHTREHVPILALQPGGPVVDLGRRYFSDIGQTLAAHLAVPRLDAGVSWAS
ncbi:MAG: phosphopentomutase [Alphaproteobacteria bacterium]